jgi:hypothetical protein
MVKGYWAGVGSRGIPGVGLPLHITTLQEDIGCALTDLGWCLSSGDAEGSDRNFHRGALRSQRIAEVGCKIYLAWDGIFGVHEDLSKGFYDASKFPNWVQAGEIAMAARGGWEGLKRGGIALHTRNAYQVLGEDLASPVAAVVFYAEPIGKSKVAGGTNTAYQIALRNNIRTINLYTEEGIQCAEKFLEYHQALMQGDAT